MHTMASGRVAALAVAMFAAGCRSTPSDGAATTSASATAAALGSSASSGSAASAGPAVSAEPEIQNVTPADKPPFESLAFRRTGKRNKNGWPTYIAYNLGKKKFHALVVWAYAYDAAGKQVARSSRPLAWNTVLEPGAKSDWDVDVGRDDPSPVPATAMSFELCYSSIWFSDDKASIDDDSKCPEQKPKSK